MGKKGVKGHSGVQIFDLHEAFFCLVLHITRRILHKDNWTFKWKPVKLDRWHNISSIWAHPMRCAFIP